MVLVTHPSPPSHEACPGLWDRNGIRKSCLQGGPTMKRRLFPEHTAPGSGFQCLTGISMQRNLGSGCHRPSSKDMFERERVGSRR